MSPTLYLPDFFKSRGHPQKNNLVRVSIKDDILNLGFRGFLKVIFSYLLLYLLQSWMNCKLRAGCSRSFCPAESFLTVQWQRPHGVSEYPVPHREKYISSYLEFPMFSLCLSALMSLLCEPVESQKHRIL